MTFAPIFQSGYQASGVRDEPISHPDLLRSGMARIDANDGSGEYTITELWWDPREKDWSPAEGPPGIVEAKAFDRSLCSNGQADQVVRFWEHRAIGGEVCRFIEAGVTEGRQTVATFCAHYAGSSETTTPFYSVPRCLNSLVQVGLDVRQCSDNGRDGDHPGNALTRASGGPGMSGWGNCIATWLGDENTWIDLAYCARDADGVAIGSGPAAIAGLHVECRVTAGGSMEIRVRNDNPHGPYFNSCVIAGAVWVTPHAAAPGSIEVGNGQDHEKVDITEGDSVWGDGVWEPRG